MSLKINGEAVRLAFLGENVIADDGSSTVRGVGADGAPWFQLESGEEMDEPYLKSYGYKCTLAECTEENHNAPIELYKWYYRCLKENFIVPKRTILSRGNTYKYPSTNVTEYTEDGEPYYRLKIPYELFKDISNKNTIFNRVILDNHFIAYSSYSNCYTVDSLETLQAMQARMNACIADVDAKILELYGFTPENPPTTVDDRVKVAKVIHDWLKINNVYNNDDEGKEDFDAAGKWWLNHTCYSALSGGDSTPVCDSYARAAHLLLDRYGIESLYVTGGPISGEGLPHAWCIVNYHDNIGDYTKDDSQWCILDATGNGGVDCCDWYWFNKRVSAGWLYNHEESLYPLPTTNPSDGDHRYSGSTRYAW